MIAINMSDVISVLSSCRPYLIGLGVVAVLAIAAAILCARQSRPVRRLVRGQALAAFVLALAVCANLICFGPMNTLLSLATGGSGTIAAESTATSNQDCLTIAQEGTVLLQNDGTLPLAAGSSLNVFGWASVNPVYGGSGAGALNDLYPKTSLLQGLTDAGFVLNEGLTDFYTAYDRTRPASYGSAWDLPEPPVDSYSDQLLADAKAFSDTALVVIARTGGEGSDLPTDMSAVAYTNNSDAYADFAPGQSYLELSQTERNLLDMVCENFDRVILVYDGANTMELGFVAEYPQIKGVLWCPGPGQTGFDALGQILAGQVNPSGKTADTFVYDLTATPYYNNFGNFAYTNMDEFMVDPSDPYMGGAVPTFVNYVEGIYVGYRFYETAAAEGLIDYDATVQYPFGYGLSYTSFTQEMGPVTESDGTIRFEVTVTNTGSVAGKDVVQVYYNPPYTNGGIEKASANLVAFAKTGELAPGASETVTISFKTEDMASYDAAGAEAYVLEAGDYVISINSDSHTVLASAVWTQPETVVYGQDNPRSTDLTAATNQFDYAAGHVTYLSRADGFANYAAATAAPADLAMPADEKAAFINTSNYVMEKDPNAQAPVTGAKNGLTLADMRGLDYDDPQWEALLDQLTVDEMTDMIAHGGFQTAAAPSVGKVATVDCDGPSAVSNNFTKAGSVGFPADVMIACTWNTALARLYGEDIGRMASELGASGWYAPSVNLHRTAFGGRNYEYFSEDGLLSGKLAAQAVQGAASHGVYAYVKHFALNEQETNRWSMLCTWINEQTLREIYLKPFELCVKEGGTTAMMSAFNYIGTVWAGGCYQLLTTVLRDEWGFDGFVDTDYFAGGYYMSADQVIAAGGANCLATFDIGTNYVSDPSDPTVLQHMRRASHDILYTVVNSNAYADGAADMGPETWMLCLIGADVVVALLVLAAEWRMLRAWRKRDRTQKAD